MIEEVEMLFKNDSVIWSSPKSLDNISSSKRDIQACSKLNSNIEKNAMCWGVVKTPTRLSSNDDKIKILSSENVTESTKTNDKPTREEDLKQAEAWKRYI